MAYFIHNKYDKDSNNKVTLANGSYTYNADSAVTVIDYYGLLESGDTTYQLLDTTSMGTDTVDTLVYFDGSIIDSTISSDKNSELIFATSINIKSIQRGTVSAAGTVNISKVDATKVLLNISGNGYGILSSATELTIGINGGTIAYEVIEFM